jgi:hypothetical protein
MAAATAMLESRPVEHDRRGGPEILLYLARMYMMLGEVRLALGMLEEWSSLPSEQSIRMLQFDPIWDPVRRDRHFQQIAAGR